MQYTTTISESSVYGITAARAAYNASIPATVNDAPNPALLQSDSAYLDFVLQAAIQSWCKQHAPVIVPDVPVVSVNGIPQSITPAQGETQLFRMGMLDSVRAILAHPDTPAEMVIAFDRASVWERTSPSVIAMLSALQQTDAEADAFFVAASQIKL